MTINTGTLRARRALALGVATLAGGMIAWTVTASAALPSQGFADLVEKVSPAVVFISSMHTPKKAERSAEQAPSQSPFPPGSPFYEFFKQFQDRMRQQAQRPMTALGSGFIIDASGDIVTNNHVIDGADKVKVKLPDGRLFDAAVVGADPRTDLALLKIKSEKPLPFVTFGNSDKLRVGDVVLAVGNPFGLGGTVTAGIVSARNRDINAGPYDDFIQTDAAINRGNSGGPLFDTAGKVVGVNTAIYSPNGGGSVGIGFAIPSSIASQVIAQIKENGSVERGWLGVKIQKVTPDIARAVGLDAPKGALVAGVIPDSPAAKAGLRQGDVILGYNGKPVAEMRSLPRLVAATAPNASVSVELWRDGRTKHVSVAIAELKSRTMAAAETGNAQPGSAQPGSAKSKRLGATLAMLTSDIKAKFKLPADTRGVVISALEPQGRAAEKGLRVGDVIERIGATEVNTPADALRAIGKTTTKAVLLLVNRGGNDMFIGLKLAGA